MALNKTLELNGTGIQLEYHKISIVYINTVSHLANIEVTSYLSEEDRFNGKFGVNFYTATDLPVDLNLPIMEQLYEHLKNTDMFVDAMDI